MATPFQTYNGAESDGVTVLVACGLLSLTSVLGLIIILVLSAVRSRRSSDKTLFVHTQVAKYFFSLLMCNLLQGVGALFNIAWIVGMRVEASTTCTAQATITQLGNVGIAAFSFVIAVHTFSQLFLRRQWSDCIFYTVLIALWGLLVLNACIGYFLVTDLKRGPYYGIVRYWCGITPAYSAERYVFEYLFMLVPAGFSFILYSLVFLRLRGNITVSAGYKVHFQPKVKAARMGARTYIVTADRHAESHLVAKQMLRHPIAYTVLVLPICATPYYTISSTPALFPVTVSTATVFLLSGFVNVVLFCTTRKDLPGSWKQKFGIGTTLYSLPGGISLSSRTDVTRRLTKTGGEGGARPASKALSIVVEKDFEIKYDVAEPKASSSTFARMALPPVPPPAHDSMQREDTRSAYIRDISFPPPIRIRLDVDYLDKNLGVGVYPAGRGDRIAWNVPQHPLHSPRRRGSGIYGSTLDLEAPSRVYPSAMPPPVVGLVQCEREQDRVD